jgi:tellurite resistance protein TehA-like permease
MERFAHIGPNWFATVMGTGIVATASTLLAADVVALRALALAAWLLAGALLVLLTGATALHWRHHPATARRHLDNPAMAPFYGTPAMALMTVAAGTVAVGPELLGTPLAVRIAFGLWLLGTAGGLVTATLIPVRLFTRHELRLADVAAPWLLAVVPPMVSAATGTAFAAHLPGDIAPTALLAVCALQFAFALVAATFLIAMLCARLARHGLGGAGMAPTLWIVLGPLGQSVTAANLLASASGTGRAPALVYGTVVLTAALAWLLMAAATTLRARPPFALTWWAFTFPVGTCVTGATTLAAAGAPGALTGVAVALFGLLIAGWVAAAIGTARGVRSGRLLAPAA